MDNRTTNRRFNCLFTMAALALILVANSAVLAQSPPGSTSRPAVIVPNFWDERTRPERPSLAGQRVIRFLTDDEYPPLHFAGADGVPTGFMVELARAACEVLDVVCTVQARRFDTLLDSLAEGRGDAVAAALPVTADLRARFGVTAPFHRMPARFLSRTESPSAGPDLAQLEDVRVAVAGGTSHEAFLKAYAPKAKLETRLSLNSALAALKAGEADLVFGDGLSIALWLNGRQAQGCCRFVGGPFLDPAFFGEGVGFILRPEDDAVRRALDYALHVLAERGTYAELYLRFFPLSFY